MSRSVFQIDYVDLLAVVHDRIIEICSFKVVASIYSEYELILLWVKVSPQEVSWFHSFDRNELFGMRKRILLVKLFHLHRLVIVKVSHYLHFFHFLSGLLVGPVEDKVHLGVHLRLTISTVLIFHP